VFGRWKRLRVKPAMTVRPQGAFRPSICPFIRVLPSRSTPERSLRPDGHCGLDPQSVPSPELSLTLRAVFATVSFCDMLFIKQSVLDVRGYPLLEFWNYELRPASDVSITNYELRITNYDRFGCINYELRITNYDRLRMYQLRITNYELRPASDVSITNYELRITNYDRLRLYVRSRP
jgi:hypothetical protein